MIEFVTGALLTDLGVEYPQNKTPKLEECERDIISIREYARIHKLDTKQRIAFEVSCCAFMLDCIERTSSNYGLGINNFSGEKRSKKTRKLLSSVLDLKSKENIAKLIKELKMKGGKSHLLMFLSGQGGSGKSYVISVAQRYCHTFCQYASIPYDDTSIYFTAMTGCAAVLLKGLTLHSATNFESTTKIRISDEERYKWMHVIILVIDEISFMSISQLTKLDRMLRRLRCEPDRPYGGINIVFIGDFHQLLPFGGAKEALYNNYSIHWHQWINTAVFLINDHRFS